KASGQERAFQRVASIERMNDHAGIDGGEGDPAADVSVELELPERDLHRDLPYRDGRHDEALTGLLRLDDGTSTARQARRIGDPPNPGTRVENDHFSRAFQSRSRGASKSGAMRTTDPRSEYPAPPVAPGDPAGTIRTYGFPRRVTRISSPRAAHPIALRRFPRNARVVVGRICTLYD